MNQEFFVFFSESLPQVINEMLSKLARNKLDGILAEACDAQFKLELNPSSTAEFASSLTFLDEIRDRVKPHRLLFLLALLHFYSSGDSDYFFSFQIVVLEEEQETVSQMYNLIKIYSVPTPPEDLVVFATLQSSVNSLHRVIDEAVAERDTCMERFCSALHEDIMNLNREVMKNKEKSEVHERLWLSSDRYVVGESTMYKRISKKGKNKVFSSFLCWRLT